MNCCYGYAIDLLVELSKTVNFTYDLHLSEEEAYGSFERVRYVFRQNCLLTVITCKYRRNSKRLCSNPLTDSDSDFEKVYLRNGSSTDSSPLPVPFH